MKRTKTIAFSAVFSALGVTLLGLGSLIEVFDLTASAAASLIIVLCMIEMNTTSAFTVYAVTAVLSLIILPNKFPAVVYLVFAGLYPIVKYYIEKIRFKLFEYALKLAFVNISVLIVLAAAKFLLGIPIPDSFEITKKIVFSKEVYIAALFALSNFAFILFDIALTGLITLYLKKYRKHFGKFFRS